MPETRYNFRVIHPGQPGEIARIPIYNRGTDKLVFDVAVDISVTGIKSVVLPSGCVNGRMQVSSRQVEIEPIQP